ncbi:MAG: hypothetical protein ACK4TA_05635 [Saprospiraceae bacterium]
MRYIIFTSFLISLFHLQAQDNTLELTSLGQKSTFHLKFGAGFGYQTYRDDAMSPLLYDGVQIGAYAGAEWRRSKGIWQLDGLFWLGETDAEQSGAYTDNYTFAVNGSYLHYLNNASKWRLALGGALTSWGSFREHSTLVNSDYFYDVFFSLGPSAAIEKPFRFLNRDWAVHWQLTLPVLSYGLRPNYSGLNESPPNDDSFTAELEAAQIGSFNVLTNVKSRLELLYPLKNGNRIGLFYYWDFYQSNIQPHVVQQAMHSVQLNLHFKL